MSHKFEVSERSLTQEPEVLHVLGRAPLRVEDAPVPVPAGVGVAVGRAHQQPQLRRRHLAAHLRDGVVENAAGVVGALADQANLWWKKKIVGLTYLGRLLMNIHY